MRKTSIPRDGIKDCFVPWYSTFLFTMQRKFVSQLSLDNVSLLCTTYNFSIQLSCLLFDIQTKNSAFDDVLRMNFNVESILMRLLPYCLEYTRWPLIRSIMHLSFASPWFGSRDKKKQNIQITWD